MNTLYLEYDLFTEDELQNTPKIISKYFNIKPIILQDLVTRKYNKQDIQNVRCGLNVAHYLGYRFEYANALNWVSAFRPYILDDLTYFQTIDYFEYDKEDYINIYPIFLRPVSPFKTFTGQVFQSYANFKKEYDYLRQNKNIDNNLLCMVSLPKSIDREYRCIFINGTYISGSQYMEKEELYVNPFVPPEIISYAIAFSKSKYFQNIPNFIIDMGEIYHTNLISTTYHLVEINGFETASFYAADIDKIYYHWNKSL